MLALFDGVQALRLKPQCNWIRSNWMGDKFVSHLLKLSKKLYMEHDIESRTTLALNLA